MNRSPETLADNLSLHLRIFSSERVFLSRSWLPAQPSIHYKTTLFDCHAFIVRLFLFWMESSCLHRRLGNVKSKISHYFNKASVLSLTVKEIGSQDQACQECLCKQIAHPLLHIPLQTYRWATCRQRLPTSSPRRFLNNFFETLHEKVVVPKSLKSPDLEQWHD